MYGGSVPSDLAWLATNKTFYPGPAFWIKPANHSAPAKLLVTSSVLAPPIAADVAWQIFQLSPYETVLGVVGYKANALQFLCDAYAPLKQLQSLLLATRAAPNRSDLLLAAHVRVLSISLLMLLIFFDTNILLMVSASMGDVLVALTALDQLTRGAQDCRRLRARD